MILEIILIISMWILTFYVDILHRKIKQLEKLTEIHRDIHIEDDENWGRRYLYKLERK